MAIAPIEDPEETDVSLRLVRSVLVRVAEGLAGSGRTLSTGETEQTLVGIEDISRIVDHLQVLAAGMAEEADLAAGHQRTGVGSLQERAEQLVRGAGPAGTAGGPAGGAGAGTGPADGSDGGADPEGHTGDGSGDGAGRNRFRNCADYLRARLGISRSEAKRRLVLAHNVVPGVARSGSPVGPPLAVLGRALGSGTVSGRAATIICSSVERVRCVARPEQLASMEQHLTLQAVESDEDVLRVVARRWEMVLDQDGQEPTEKVLRTRQGVFLRGRRHGLHILEIGATDEQFEQLATVMNTATNPRAARTLAASATVAHPGTPGVPGALDGAGDPHLLGDSGASQGDEDRASSVADAIEAPTRAQSMLDGLVGACRIALSTTHLPATGGHRPQVMVTIDYRDLVADVETLAHPDVLSGVPDTGSWSPSVGGSTMGGSDALERVRRAGHGAPSRGARTGGPADRPGTGRAVFTEHLSARSIRRIACDADIVPLVLGGEGQVLDIGRAARLFPPHLRRALVARDRGCAFPDCTIPASWCEAHHMTPWSRGRDDEHRQRGPAVRAPSPRHPPRPVGSGSAQRHPVVHATSPRESPRYRCPAQQVLARPARSQRC
ncbi:HNH endonuclease signature motif containing protein [Arthrobacter agilis]|uniref:HNH endonuclease signature motif containing protein n=1 Tax=Arthrobacter agilis TaxID=37921 RepID=UPI002782DBD2|nr:HNH endonuclease signature motif containing protein [Arthrobacter agilis]MDQ0735848.1 hypothetical protein [Arthrobacter agilis]